MLSGAAKNIAKNICDVFPYLPDAKKEWLLGFGEGIAFAKTSSSTPETHQKPQESGDLTQYADSPK